MKITKINIYNFGPFYGEHEITFPGEGEGIHIIRGNTGQGKTSLQRAILWCLYGRVLDRKGKEVRPTSLLNRSAFRDAIYQFWVRIFFNHEGESWSISRQMSASAHQDSRYYRGMKLDVVKDGVVQSNAASVIERLLPYDVSRFFFFDGEMLRDYEELLEQDSASMKLLKNSVEHILGIPYLKLARDDIIEVKKAFNTDRTKIIRKLGGKDYEELADVYQLIIEEISRKEGLIKELDNQISETEIEIHNLKRRLVDLEEVKKLAQERLNIEREIEICEEKANSEREKLKNLNSSFYKSLLLNISDNICKKLNIKHQHVMDKYNEKQRLLKYLDDLNNSIKKVKCELCGNILNEKELKILEKEKSETIIKIDNLTEIPEPNLEYEGYRNILNNLSISKIDRNEFKKIEGELLEITHKIATLTSKCNKIKDKLISVDEEEPFRIENKIRTFERELGRLEGEKNKLEEDLLLDLDTKSELDQKLSSINQDELNILNKRIELITSIENVFEKTISLYREKRRKEVESKSSKIFKNLRSKKDFDRLEINENFGLSIITNKGVVINRAEWRSAGEEQIVAFSLVGALNKCAQIQAPVFMDAPLGRLDIQHGKSVINFIPDLSEQVVLLVTDREFRKEDELLISKKIKSDHTLIYRGEERGSHIIKTKDIGGSI
ncbi:MAG: AAA family ATPase [Candidatus Hodarchaeales archaeon]